MSSAPLRIFVSEPGPVFLTVFLPPVRCTDEHAGYITSILCTGNSWSAALGQRVEEAGSLARPQCLFLPLARSTPMKRHAPSAQCPQLNGDQTGRGWWGKGSALLPRTMMEKTRAGAALRLCDG